MNRFGHLLAAGLLFAGVGCSAREAPAPADKPAAPATTIFVPAENHPGPAAQRRRAPETEIKPAWPAGWRLVDAGRAGDDSRPLFWFRLEAGGVSPEEAVRLALGALRPLAGPLEMQDAVAAQSRDEAIGQFRGARLRGVVQASVTREVASVQVTLEPTS